MVEDHTEIQRTDFFDKSVMVALTRAVTEISSCLEQHQLLQITAFHLNQLLDGDGCLIFGWNPQTQQNIICELFDSPAYRTFKEKPDPAVLRESPRVNTVAREGRILQVHIPGSALAAVEAELIHGTGLQSVLMLPLAAGERFQGVMAVLHIQKSRLYDKQDILIGHLISSQAATSLDNAYLYQDLRQRSEELEAVRKATLSITASLDLQQVLNAILESSMSLLNDVQTAHIFLYKDGRLTFGAARSVDGPMEKLTVEPRPDGLTYTVARQGKEIFVEDAKAHPAFGYARQDWHGAIMGLPLKIGTTVVGVMNVAYSQPRQFLPDQFRVIRLLGDQAALAIEKARLHQLIDQQAHTDALTGLPNRRAFAMRLELEVLRSRRYHHPFSLVMMDLNLFKAVNDTYGHPVGDVVLQQTAEFMQGSIRDTDFVARYGGDEFIFIFPETNLSSAERILKKILANYAEFSLQLPGGKTVKLSAEAGIAVFPDMATDGTNLLQLADQEMYQGKRRLGHR